MMSALGDLLPELPKCTHILDGYVVKKKMVVLKIVYVSAISLPPNVMYRNVIWTLHLEFHKFFTVCQFFCIKVYKEILR